MLTLELALIHTACSHAAANDKANEEWGNERPVHFEKRNHDPCTARAAHIFTHTTPDPKIRRPNKPAADMDPCAERAAALLAPATRALLLGHSACGGRFDSRVRVRASCHLGVCLSKKTSTVLKTSNVLIVL